MTFRNEFRFLLVVMVALLASSCAPSGDEEEQVTAVPSQAGPQLGQPPSSGLPTPGTPTGTPGGTTGDTTTGTTPPAGNNAPQISNHNIVQSTGTDLKRILISFDTMDPDQGQSLTAKVVYQYQLSSGQSVDGSQVFTGITATSSPTPHSYQIILPYDGVWYTIRTEITDSGTPPMQAISSTCNYYSAIQPICTTCPQPLPTVCP